MADKPEKRRHRPRVIFSLRYKFSLAMILLTAAVVLSITRMFMQDEITIMTRAVEDYASRETWHLANIAQDALSTQNDLAVGVAVDNIMASGVQREAKRYIHVVDAAGTVIKSSDSALNGTLLSDPVTAEAMKYTDRATARKISLPDPNEKGGTIFDFALPVFHRTNPDLRLATIRLGFSDLMIRKQIERIQKLTLYITIGFIAMSVVLALILAQITTGPLKKLSSGVSIIGTGNLDHKIQVRSRDEIGQLAAEFNLMTTELKESRGKEIENALMQEQLEVAKEIQEGLNPMGFYNKRGVQIKGYTRAAKGVGGDYFDYKDIDENRVGALISDVSGKGIPASLVMVMIRTVFVAALHSERRIHCSEVLSYINRSLSADFAIDKFATLLFMIFDRQSGMLEFSNAGHGPVFCYRAASNRCSVTKLDGVPIGIMEESEYEQGKIPLNAGDIVVMYTDGITEMRNESKEEYGRARLQQLIIENNHLNADALTQMIVEDVDSFKGEANQHDDMTVLVMKRVS